MEFKNCSEPGYQVKWQGKGYVQTGHGWRQADDLDLPADDQPGSAWGDLPQSPAEVLAILKQAGGPDRLLQMAKRLAAHLRGVPVPKKTFGADAGGGLSHEAKRKLDEWAEAEDRKALENWFKMREAMFERAARREL